MKDKINDMKKFIAIIVLLISTISLKAQVFTHEHYEYDRFQVGTSVSSLISPFPTLQLKMDIAVAKNVRLTWDVGALFGWATVSGGGTILSNIGVDVLLYSNEKSGLSIGPSYLFREKSSAVAFLILNTTETKKQKLFALNTTYHRILSKRFLMEVGVSLTTGTEKIKNSEGPLWNSTSSETDDVKVHPAILNLGFSYRF